MTMTLEMELRLAAEWRARVGPLPTPGARRALSADELAALDADLAARTADQAARQMIGEMARSLGAYARRPMTGHEHRLAWEREQRSGSCE